MKFKSVFIACCILFLIGIGFLIQNSNLSRTVDFSGEITGVAESDDGVITLFAVSNGGQFVFRIDDRSKLENSCEEEISPEELKKGSLIQVNYRKYLFKDEDVHTVKELVVYD